MTGAPFEVTAIDSPGGDGPVEVSRGEDCEITSAWNENAREVKGAMSLVLDATRA